MTNVHRGEATFEPNWTVEKKRRGWWWEEKVPKRSLIEASACQSQREYVWLLDVSENENEEFIWELKYFGWPRTGRVGGRSTRKPSLLGHDITVQSR